MIVRRPNNGEIKGRVSGTVIGSLLPPLQRLYSHLHQSFFCFTIWKRTDGRNSSVRIFLGQRTSLLQPIALKNQFPRLKIISYCSIYSNVENSPAQHLPLQKISFPQVVLTRYCSSMQKARARSQVPTLNPLQPVCPALPH